MSDLLPCPFCGGAASAMHSDDDSPAIAVMCHDCGAQAPWAPGQSAIVAWNRRAPIAGWRDMKDAPKDGTSILAHIPGFGSNAIIKWADGFMNSDGEDCGGWVFANEGDPYPADWTDGACWALNANESPSTPPTHWVPLPAAPVDGGEDA